MDKHDSHSIVLSVQEAVDKAFEAIFYKFIDQDEYTEHEVNEVLSNYGWGGEWRDWFEDFAEDVG